MPNSPIILFVYNRPMHTQRCLESLRLNPEAADSVLYIFADGPKADATAKERKAIEATRQVIRQAKWCKDVIIVEADENKGLADSIKDGVDTILRKYEKVIVLEDDNVLSTGCLKYLNDALDLYENDHRVMHISSYMFPVQQRLPETFFYLPTTCMGGWATWRRAWKKLEWNPDKLMKTIEKKFDPDYFNLDGYYGFMGHLRSNAEGKMKTWAIRWQASVYINNGLSLHPGRSLAQNIGFDESGVHSNWHHRPLFHNESLAKQVEVKPIPLVESKEAREAMKALYANHYRPGLMKKIRRKLISGLYRIKKMVQ